MDLNATDLRSYLLDQLLPLWATSGRDERFGGFESKLSHTLEPVAADTKRVLVQARQLWTFSRAASDAGVPEFRRLADRQFEFLVDRCRDAKNGGWFATLTSAGQPQDRSKDTYIHAFVLFALAEYFALSRESRALEEAEHTIEVLDSKLGDSAGRGYLESASHDWIPDPAMRRQNPHMHLLEAFLALYEATRDSAHLDSAGQMIELFRTVFFEPEVGFLREYFGADWSVSVSDGERVEPGHHFEWVFLLNEYVRLGGDDAVRDDAKQLFAFAMKHGIDCEHGGVFDEIHSSGRLLRDTKRVWPQTEYLRAAALLEPKRVPEVLRFCWDRYVAPEHGGWYEQTDRVGAVISEAMNASSVYHIYGALSQVAELGGS